MVDVVDYFRQTLNSSAQAAYDIYNNAIAAQNQVAEQFRVDTENKANYEKAQADAKAASDQAALQYEIDLQAAYKNSPEGIAASKKAEIVASFTQMMERKVAEREVAKQQYLDAAIAEYNRVLVEEANPTGRGGSREAAWDVKIAQANISDVTRYFDQGRQEDEVLWKNFRMQVLGGGIIEASNTVEFSGTTSEKQYQADVQKSQRFSDPAFASAIFSGADYFNANAPASLLIGTPSQVNQSVVWSGSGWTDQKNIPSAQNVYQNIYAQPEGGNRTINFVQQVANIPSVVGGPGTENIATIYNPVTGQYMANDSYTGKQYTSYGLTNATQGIPTNTPGNIGFQAPGAASAIYNDIMKIGGNANPNIIGLAMQQGNEAAYNKYSPTSMYAGNAPVQSTVRGGAAFDMVTEMMKGQGSYGWQAPDPTLLATAVSQGYGGKSGSSLLIGLDMMSGRNTVPTRSLSSMGGSMVTDASGRTMFVEDARYLVSDSNFNEIASKKFNISNLEANYPFAGGVIQLGNRTDSGGVRDLYTRMNPVSGGVETYQKDSHGIMQIGGGGDYFGQSGAGSVGTPHSRLVYNQDLTVNMGLSKPGWERVLRNPTAFSKAGDEVYGMWAGEDLNSVYTVGSSPGNPMIQYPSVNSTPEDRAAWYQQAFEIGNYNEIANTQKNPQGFQKDPFVAYANEVTRSRAPIANTPGDTNVNFANLVTPEGVDYQKGDKTPGYLPLNELRNYGDIVTSNPREGYVNNPEPATLLVRLPDTIYQTVPAENRVILPDGTQYDNSITGNPKYASQFGGYLINNKDWQGSAAEVAENQKYNDMIAGMAEDKQRQIDANRQTWVLPGGIGEIPNPKYGQVQQNVYGKSGSDLTPRDLTMPTREDVVAMNPGVYSPLTESQIKSNDFWNAGANNGKGAFTPVKATGLPDIANWITGGNTDEFLRTGVQATRSVATVGIVGGGISPASSLTSYATNKVPEYVGGGGAVKQVMVDQASGANLGLVSNLVTQWFPDQFPQNDNNIPGVIDTAISYNGTYQREKVGYIGKGFGVMAANEGNSQITINGTAIEGAKSPSGISLPTLSVSPTLYPLESTARSEIVAGTIGNLDAAHIKAWGTAQSGKTVLQATTDLVYGGIDYDKSLVAGLLSQLTWSTSQSVIPAKTYVTRPAVPESTVVTISGGNETITKMGDWLKTEYTGIENARPTLDKTDLAAVTDFNTRVATYTSTADTYKAMFEQNPVIQTTTTIPATPEERKNQWELFVGGSAAAVRAATGTSMDYLNAREQIVKNEPGWTGVYDRLQYGAEKYMLTEPANLAPLAIQTAAIVYGAGAVGGYVGGVALTGSRLAPLATALVSPTGQAVIKGGVGVGLTGIYAYDVTEKFTATPEQTQINIGSTLPGLGVMWGAGGGMDWMGNGRAFTPRTTNPTTRGQVHSTDPFLPDSDIAAVDAQLNRPQRTPPSSGGGQIISDINTPNSGGVSRGQQPFKMESISPEEAYRRSGFSGNLHDTTPSASKPSSPAPDPIYEMIHNLADGKVATSSKSQTAKATAEKPSVSDLEITKPKTSSELFRAVERSSERPAPYSIGIERTPPPRSVYERPTPTDIIERPNPTPKIIEIPNPKIFDPFIKYDPYIERPPKYDPFPEKFTKVTPETVKPKPEIFEKPSPIERPPEPIKNVDPIIKPKPIIPGLPGLPNLGGGLSGSSGGGSPQRSNSFGLRFAYGQGLGTLDFAGAEPGKGMFSQQQSQARQIQQQRSMFGRGLFR